MKSMIVLFQVILALVCLPVANAQQAYEKPKIICGEDPERGNAIFASREMVGIIRQIPSAATLIWQLAGMFHNHCLTYDDLEIDQAFVTEKFVASATTTEGRSNA